MTKKIGFLIGSLRQGSFNRKIAVELKELFPQDYQVDIIELKDLPFYNTDLDKPENNPYNAFRDEITSHDAFVFFSPEYNRSFTPVLKNALDVASLPHGKNGWAGKPAAVISASMGVMAGLASNLSIRQVFVYNDLIPLQQPEVYLGKVQDRFDENGKLKEDTKEFLQKFVDAFVVHVERISK